MAVRAYSYQERRRYVKVSGDGKIGGERWIRIVERLRRCNS